MNSTFTTVDHHVGTTLSSVTDTVRVPVALSAIDQSASEARTDANISPSTTREYPCVQQSTRFQVDKRRHKNHLDADFYMPGADVAHHVFGTRACWHFDVRLQHETSLCVAKTA